MAGNDCLSPDDIAARLSGVAGDREGPIFGADPASSGPDLPLVRKIAASG